MRWQHFPCDPLECSGLPWMDENAPDLWRLPRRLADALPVGVLRQARFASGASLRLRADTSELRLRVRRPSESPASGLDVYVNGQFWSTARVPEGGETEVVCFAGASRKRKDTAVYLPLRCELQILAYGIDDDAVCEPSRSFAGEKPLVLYGSSIAQGIGASRPGMAYAAILGRSLDSEYVNLGFGGAGKAEAEVVSLVSEVEACCYVLDLGKSYGHQAAEPYTAMLGTLRQDHPGIPIVCITPIFASLELYSSEYVELSRHTRAVVRESIAARIAQGDNLLFLVEGEGLLSSQDSDALSGDALHPNDLGHSLIAQRVRPAVEAALRAAKAPRENAKALQYVDQSRAAEVE